MIEHILVLADESASFRLGGLRLLDRLLRGLEEDFTPNEGDDTAPPRITVLWRSTPLAEKWPSISLSVKHLMSGQVRGAEPRLGPTLLLRSNAVFGRGVLPQLLLSQHAGARLPVEPFAVVDGLTVPLKWDDLAGLLPAVQCGAVDLTHGFVGVVGEPPDLPRVERALFKSLGKPLDGLVARHINRPISTRLSRPLARFGVTPNQASLLVLVCLVAGAWALAAGTLAGFLGGALLYNVASVLDGCDGEIARVKFQESRSGAWFDTAVDIFGHQLFVVALGIGLWRQHAWAPKIATEYLWEGIITAAGIALGVWLVARYTERTSGADHFNDLGSSVVDESALPGWLRKLGYLIAQLARRDSYALIFVFMALIGRADWILHALAIGVVAHFPGIAWLWWRRIGVPVASDVRTVAEG